MKLYSWNVNGVRAATRNGFLDWMKKASPDVLCLQETKALPDQLDENLTNPPGYNVYWHSAVKKGYSGVATFSKPEPVLVENGIGIDKYDEEGRVLRTDFDDFVLFNIYFPNAQRDLGRVDFKMEFCDLVLDKCNELVAQGKNVLVCGDYNTAHKEIDLKHPKPNQNNAGFLPVERAWIDKFIENGYVDTFRQFNREADQYTWWTYRLNARERNIGWRIDYFFVSENALHRVKNAGILPEVKGSDHCPVFIEWE